MANRQFHLNDKQVNELKRYELQAKRPAEFKRLQAIRLYGTGHTLAAIVEIVGCGTSSVRIWAMQYRQKGVAGLLAQYDNSRQNARKLSIEQEQNLREKLTSYRPDQIIPQAECHGTGEFWTVADVKTVVQKWYGVLYRDVSSYRHLLHRCGFSYQKTEQVYKSRPAARDVADFEAELEKN